MQESAGWLALQRKRPKCGMLIQGPAWLSPLSITTQYRYYDWNPRWQSSTGMLAVTAPRRINNSVPP